MSKGLMAVPTGPQLLPMPEAVPTYFNHFVAGKGRVTIALKETGGGIYYGLSLCSPESNFEKAYGKTAAEKRLEDYRRGILNEEELHWMAGKVTLGFPDSCEPRMTDVALSIVRGSRRPSSAAIKAFRPTWFRRARVSFRAR